MSFPRLTRISGWLLPLGMLLLSEPSLLACSACFGKSDSNMAKGMNMGIFALLLVITTVLCGVAGFFVFLARRSSQLEGLQTEQGFSTQRTNV